MKKLYVITKWCKSITDDGKDLYTHKKLDTENIVKFRLLDDDGIIYAYGIMDKDRFLYDENVEGFEPLDRYMYDYGCTEIQYMNDDGIYETLYGVNLHPFNLIYRWKIFTVKF